MAESTEKKTVAKRTSDLSDEVLEQIEVRQRAAIAALRKIVDRLDDATPDLVDPALRKKVIDAIGDYYEQLANTTNELVRKAVHGDTKDLYGFLRSFIHREGETAGKQRDDANNAD